MEDETAKSVRELFETDAIQGQFSTMASISDVVGRAFVDAEIVAPMVDLGIRIARDIKASGLCNHHDERWVAKKVHDAIRVRTWRLVNDTYNLEFKLEEGYTG